MTSIKQYTIFLASLALLTTCVETEDINIYNKDLVFPQAYMINIEPYSYFDSTENKLYFVNADSIADTLGKMPVFRWKNITAGLITVAVSTEPFYVSYMQIINTENIIWQWHTGLKKSFVETGGNKFTQVSFIDGRTVENKNILYETQPLPLENGLYFWSVWAWDRSGKKITYSSRQMQFIVK